MHLFRFKISESAIQKSVDNEYLCSIYRQMNKNDIEELLIIRQKEYVEIFIIVQCKLKRHSNILVAAGFSLTPCLII